MTDRDQLQPAFVLGASLFLGLVLGGWALGNQIEETRLADRYVTVKGLVERTVQADHASWSISYKETGDNLAPVLGKTETDKTGVLAFLAKQGFRADDVSISAPDITDTTTENTGQDKRPPYHYLASQSIQITSTDIPKLAAATGHTGDLLQAGIVVSSASPSYQFTGLNALKPDMITEATRNARASADRFAADSGAAVGGIRSANQGVFSITAADAAMLNPGDDGGGNETSSIEKKVRVVATVEYYLK